MHHYDGRCCTRTPALMLWCDLSRDVVQALQQQRRNAMMEAHQHKLVADGVAKELEEKAQEVQVLSGHISHNQVKLNAAVVAQERADVRSCHGAVQVVGCCQGWARN